MTKASFTIFKTACFILVAFSINLHAQESKSLVVRSTTTSVTNTNAYDSKHLLQQSIGQSSLTGDYSSGGYLLSQGFVQPNLWDVIVSSEHKLNLNARVYPNPFVDELNLEFLDNVNAPLEIKIFTDLGNLVQTLHRDPSKNVLLSLNELPPGKYFLNVLSGDRQFVARLLKLN